MPLMSKIFVKASGCTAVPFSMATPEGNGKEVIFLRIPFKPSSNVELISFSVGVAIFDHTFGRVSRCLAIKKDARRAGDRGGDDRPRALQSNCYRVASRTPPVSLTDVATLGQLVPSATAVASGLAPLATRYLKPFNPKL